MKVFFLLHIFKENPPMSKDKKKPGYKKLMSIWKKSEPKGGNNYDKEAWLEEKPTKKGKLSSW